MLALFSKRYGRWLCAGFVCLLMAACATPQKITDVGPAGQAFERAGRFALGVDYSNGRQNALQGGFAWRDDGQVLILDLANPLGSTLARVRVVPGQATLTRPDGSQDLAESPDGLVEIALGSPIPVSGLRDWLQGRSGPAPVQALKKNEAGQLASFEQSGWRVVLSRYDAVGPRLIQLNRDDANRSVRVRLVIDTK